MISTTKAIVAASCSSTETKVKEGTDGFWNSIRETIVCTLQDERGEGFQVRLLVDPGANISTIPLFTLCMTEGNWDVDAIPAISIAGINSINQCELVCHAKILPGEHITEEFRGEYKVPQKFSVSVDFFLMKGMQVFTSYKPALPRDIVSTLSGKHYCLADPEQISPHDNLIYIHGILGGNALAELGRKAFETVPQTKMTTCRSYFGDLLLGPSHFIPKKPLPKRIPMNDHGRRVGEAAKLDNNIIMCSASMASLGLNEVTTEETMPGISKVSRVEQDIDPTIFEYCDDE